MLCFPPWTVSIRRVNTMKDMSFLWGVPGCVIGRHEVSLQKEGMLKCPDDEIGSSPGSREGLQEERASSPFTTTEDKSLAMMGCDRGT